MREDASFHIFFFEKDDLILPRKRKAMSHYGKGEASAEFVSKAEEYYHHFSRSN